MDTQGNSLADLATVGDFVRLAHCFSHRSPHAHVAVRLPDATICHVNDAFLQLSRLSREDLIGLPFSQGIPAANPACLAMIADVFATGVAGSIAEQPHAINAAVYWSYTAWPLNGDDGCPLGVMIEIIDSTEIATFRKNSTAMNESLLLSNIRHQELVETFHALNTQLQHAVQDKEYFIAVLSHELRTPLTPILIAALMLQRDPRLDPETRDVMEMIHRNATLEARLIDDLLDLTRVERGKLNLDRRPIDLRDVIHHAVEGSRSDIESASLSLHLELADHPHMLAGDASRLQQVFSNLLRNAVKFTPPGGSITVRAWCEEDTCVAQVTDTGTGMNADFLPHAFSPFEQADRSHARKGGLGLGLTICKTIIDLHGGVISAASDGPNTGTTFTIRLPAASPTFQPIIASNDTPVRPVRILLVEDHPDTARTMRRLLTSEGHSVQWAPDVATGLHLAATEHFDLLLSDIGLPDGSGVDLMRSLRQRGSLLPGIVLSGFGQDQDIARSRDAGFSTHLLKPLSLAKLHEAIAALVG